MRAPAVSFAKKIAAATLAALLTFALVPCAYADGEGTSEGNADNVASGLPDQSNDSTDSSGESQEASAEQDAEGSPVAPMLASGLAGKPSSFINSDVALDGEPVIGSFTLDGLTFAVIDEATVKLVGVSEEAGASPRRVVASSQGLEAPDVLSDLGSTPASSEADTDAGMLTLPESVAYEGTAYTLASIAPYAFYLSGVTSVTLPASVSDVDDRAFRSSDVASVTVAEGNPSYSSFDGALYDAEQLSLLLIPEGKQGTVRIPKTAETVEASVFSHCPLVDSISVDAGSAAFASENGLLYTSDLTTLLRVPAGAEEITIREGCTTIAAGALEACAELTTINAPASVTSISPDIFHAIPTVSLPAASLTEEAPQLTAMVALSSATDELPGAASSAVVVMLPDGASGEPWQSIGLAESQDADQGEATVQVSVAYAATASNMPLYAADGRTVAARWSLDSSGTLSVVGVPGQVVSLAFSEASYKEWRSSTYRFSIKKIVLDNLDVADAAWWFYNMPEVETLELKGTVFASTTSLHHFLHACSKLNTIVNFSLLHCKNLTNASCIFMGCESLAAVPASFRLPSSVTSATHLFFGTPITTLNGFTLPPNIKNVTLMFHACSNLESLPDGFTIPPSVTQASGMFEMCNRLWKIPSSFSVPPGLSAADKASLFTTQFSSAGLANFQKEGRVDLEGKLITVYTGNDSVTKGMDWASMGRRLGTQKIVLTWNYNEGSLDSAASRITGQAYSPGQKVLIPNSPERGGYDFNGWYTAKAEGQQVNAVTILSSNNATYYAHWSTITYDIAYVTAGGGLEISNPRTYTVEDRVVLKNSERAGYAALGWKVEGASGVGAVTENSITTIREGTYGALSCTALWKANPYTIAFDTQGGPEVPSISATYDQDVTLPAPGARNGYRFTGWNTKADGSGTAYQAGIALAKPNLATSGTAKLFAQWDAVISAVVPLEVQAQVDVLGLEAPKEAQGYIESRCGEPLKVARVDLTPLDGAKELFGEGNVGNVSLEVLANNGASPNARFSLGASATESDASRLQAFTMASYGARVPISYRFAMPPEVQTSLLEHADPKPVCTVAYTVALA